MQQWDIASEYDTIEAEIKGNGDLQNLLKTVVVESMKPVIEKLDAYISATDIPILGEFCYKIGLDEALLTKIKDTELKNLLTRLENKKKAALERRIYDAELNATIGSHLLKTWREDEQREAAETGKIEKQATRTAGK